MGWSVLAHLALVEGVRVVGDADKILQWIKLLHGNCIIIEERLFFVT